MRRAVRAALLFASFASFVGACNAISGASELGVCEGEVDCTALAGEGGSLEATTSEDAPQRDGAKTDAATAPFFGTGRSGPLTVANGASMTINAYAAVVAATKTGDTVVSVSDAAAFGAGDLFLIWQAAGLVNAVSGDQTPVVLTPSSVGHYELARAAAVGAGKLTLAAPLAFTYASVGAQVVRLPEYTDVTIPMTSKITGLAWNGASGGIVAFLATGAVTVLGEIVADGLGFRGGVGFKGTSPTGCIALDGQPGVGYAAKGEGIALGGYSTASDGGGIGGRGNLANGAGGGVCHNGGGAGGGHGGVGGVGGAGMNGNGLGGLGGAPLKYAPFSALLMGGGGAAGDDNNGVPLPNGGAGGGVVFVKARTMGGSGAIGARGAFGVAAPGNDGSGGGGAGGAIVIVAETKLDGVVLHAEGASGASATGAGGGGGGGGVVDVSTRLFRSSAFVTGGTGGGVGTFLAEPGANGRFNVADGG